MPIKIETDEEYHAGEGVSKSGLWTLWTKTPFHYRFTKKESKPAQDLGKAAHIAILEPERLEMAVAKGPMNRIKRNEWQEFTDYCKKFDLIGLTEPDYEMALMIRDLAAKNEYLNLLRDGDHFVETSAYHVDEETGMLVKCRPDVGNKTHGILMDIKNMADGSAAAFSRDIGKFGYHVQDALYTDVWSKGGSFDVNAFIFLVMEKNEPPLMVCYEIDAKAAAEGHAIYRDALAKYAECVKTDTWPGYPDGVQRIGLRSKWDYKLTDADEEV